MVNRCWSGGPIPSLQAAYPGVPIGYSGHEFGLAPTWAAVTLGATFVERHITLDRAMWGSDQAASVERGEVGHAARAIDLDVLGARLHRDRGAGPREMRAQGLELAGAPGKSRASGHEAH